MCKSIIGVIIAHIRLFIKQKGVLQYDNIKIMRSNQNQKRIYLDYAASTPVDRRVKEAMEPYWSLHFGNPGGIHKEGVIAKKAVDDARKSVAESIGAREPEIIFTSGGTEGNNLSIFGLVRQLKRKGTPVEKMHFITTSIEHPSVLDIYKELEREGASVSFIGVTEEGVVDLEELKEALQPETVLVSVMHANNEIGTIQPVDEIAKIIRKYRKDTNGESPLFHVDSSQVPLYLDVSAPNLGVDFMVFDGQKIYGPKGVGALYIKKDLKILSLFYGGKQERCLRPGTENVSLIVGFKEAFVNAVLEREIESARLTKLRDYFIDTLLKKVPQAVLNGSLENRLPNNANFYIPEMDDEWFVLQMDARGIAISTRSACIGGEYKGSYVVAALGKGEEQARSSFRFTMGKQTTKEDMEYVIEMIEEIVKKSSTERSSSENR